MSAPSWITNPAPLGVTRVNASAVANCNRKCNPNRTTPYPNPKAPIGASVAATSIGVVIGASFQSIVDAIVNGLLMPPIRALSGTLPGEAWIFQVGQMSFGIGAVINAIIQFVLVALAVFFHVKGLNALHLREEEKKPAAKADPNTKLLEEIRDLLRSKG